MGRIVNGSICWGDIGVQPACTELEAAVSTERLQQNMCTYAYVADLPALVTLPVSKEKPTSSTAAREAEEASGVLLLDAGPASTTVLRTVVHACLAHRLHCCTTRPSSRLKVCFQAGDMPGVDHD